MSTTPEFRSYLIRRIPCDVWALFQAKAKTEGRTAMWVLQRLILEYIQHGVRS